MLKRRLSIVLASCAAVAAVLTVVPGPSPAAAAVVDQQLDCGSLGGSQTMKVNGTAPSTVGANGTFTVTLAPQAGKADGAAIKNLEWAFQVPAGSQVVANSATTVGSGTTTGGSIGTPAAAISGNTVFLRVPGKIGSGATFTPPALRFEVKATGAVGTQLPIKVRTSGTAYKLTADIVGGIAVSCTAKNAVNTFTNTTIVGATTTTAVTTTTTDGGSTTTTTAPPPVITTEVWTPTGACGSVQTKVVPAGTMSAALEAVGGKGGKGGDVAFASGGSGRDGGRVTATATPAPGSTISATVGCVGSGGSSSSGTGGAGFSGGGNGGKGEGTLTSDHYGGGGGGASAICLGPNCTTTLATPLVVAAGGGAGGSLNCAGTRVGAGGLGGNGTMTSAPGTVGTGPSGINGEGGLHSSGGTGGVNNAPGAGRGGDGGNGRQGSGSNSGGGGGGGGYIGGAGGTGTSGGLALCAGGGGGGGGSSFAASTTASAAFATAGTASAKVTFTIKTDPTDPTDPDNGSVYVPLVPCRILDTRNEGGVLGNGETKAIQVTGRPTCVVPAKATAVEASVSAVEPAAGGFTRLWPTGANPPAATFLNYTKAQGTTNTGAISISSSGSMSLRSFNGPSHYTVDLQGYYIAPADLPAATVGSVYVAMKPCRILDTRTAGGALSGDQTQTVPVTGIPGCSVPAKATAIEASASAVEPTASGFARMWPNGEPPVTATFVNYTKAQGTTNTGAVPLGTGGKLVLRNFRGAADYTLDVQGYFIHPADLDTGVVGSRYHALVPCRVYDSRTADGMFTADQISNHTVTGSSNTCGIASGATAFEASVSATEPISGGFGRLWPQGGSPATATFVNYTKGQGTTNTGSVSLSTAGGVTVRNFTGTTHYVIDVQGYWKTAPAAS